MRCPLPYSLGVIGERSPEELCDWGRRGNGVVPRATTSSGDAVDAIEVAGEVDDERRKLRIRQPLQRLGEQLDG